MCRLLYIKSNRPLQIADYLHEFATIAKNSREYQGHGWGMAYYKDDTWSFYKNIKPVREDNLDQFGQSHLVLAHARSAFNDADIGIENNMPFYDDRNVFIFNGEIRGVQLKLPGRIGAEKIFNLIKNFNKGNLEAALRQANVVLQKRSRYVRAINLIIADKNNIYVSSHFNEDADYFTMYIKKTAETTTVCSEAFYGEKNWQPLQNGSIRRLT